MSTLVIIFNLLLIIAVIKNKFLHFSLHYVIVVLSLRWVDQEQHNFDFHSSYSHSRNQLRVGLSISLVFLAKLLQTPDLLKHTNFLPANDSDTDFLDLDLTQADSMPTVCKILCMTDHVLMTSLMFYLAALAVYMFCRHPTTPLFSSCEDTMKVTYY